MDVILILGGAILLIIIFGLVLITRYYRQVPPSEVLVVFGGRGGTRMVKNGGTFITPFFERFKRLDLRIMTIKTEKDEVYTVSGVPIQLDWVSQVQIDSEDAALRTAAKAFLDKTQIEIHTIIKETLSANFRAIVGQMSVEAIHRDRDDFVQRVQDLASDDVAAMGVKIISMGIEEITDNEGYLQAMAAPQIAAIKRDATIAQAEAEREARVKAATAKREAEQAELNAEREILAQREALNLREVQVQRQIGLAQAEADREVQAQRALAVEKQQEAEVLVPARADRQAVEIRAEAERKRLEIEAEAKRNQITISADAEAQATRQRANAEAESVEKRALADAAALQAMKQAEAEGQKAQAEGNRARLLAEAEGEKAKLLAAAEGEKAKLLAEAEGRRELAAASAAEGEINLRQFLIEQVTQSEVEKVRAVASAMAGLGSNVRIVQIGGENNGNGNGTGNTLMDLIMHIPEVSEVFRAKTEALSGEDFEKTLLRIGQLFAAIRTMDPTQTIEITTPPKAES